MDQIKAMLPAIKQHSFWGLCVLVLAISVGSWWMSTATLQSDKQTRLNEIKSSFDTLEGLQKNQPKHPNAGTNKEMENLNARYTAEVAKAWQMQYDAQAGILVWPASFDARFRDIVEKLRPIEMVPAPTVPPTPSPNDLPLEERQMYRNYIYLDLPNLATTIRTIWKAKTGSDAGGGSGGTTVGGVGSLTGGGGGQKSDGEDRSVVIWPQANQQEIMDGHFGFTGRTEPPSTLEVLYAQEDMWVLQNLMDIIKATNDDATARHEAAIKEIYFVRIGRSAMGLAGSISGIGQASGGPSGGMSMPGGMPGSGGGGGGGAGPAVSSPGGASGAGGLSAPGAGGPAAGGMGAGPSGLGGGGAASQDPAEGRYVDEKYQPLPASRLRLSLTSRSPDDALLAVAKRMPVRVRFRVDQRKLNRLLAECGNSRLPVEIRQVRINRPPATSGSQGGGGGGGGGMSAMLGGGGDPSASAGFGDGDSGGASTTGSTSSGFGDSGGGVFGGSSSMGRGSKSGNMVADASIDPNLLDVEIYGIVYIFNPVNKSQLGLPAAPATVAAPAAPSGPAVPTTPTSTGGGS